MNGGESRIKSGADEPNLATNKPDRTYFFLKRTVWTFTRLVPGLTNCKAHTLFDFVTMRLILFEPRYEKTGFLHMQKQRRRSAAQ